MNTIKLLDNNFLGDLGSSKEFPPTKFSWDRGAGTSDLVVFTDNCLALADLAIHKNAKKIALVFEPHPINPKPYQYLVENFHKFDLVLSHNADFVRRLGEKGAWFQNGMSLIKPADWKPHPKTKFMSMIVSNKMMTADHGFRLNLVKAIKQLKLPVDIYGKGINFIQDKADGLRDYKFSICCENCQIDSYVSDKIIDAFATYTVPVYRGCESSKKMFNNDGVWHFNTIDECINLIRTLEEDQDAIYYDKAQIAMKDNFDWGVKNRSAENWIWDNIFVPRRLV